MRKKRMRIKEAERKLLGLRPNKDLRYKLDQEQRAIINRFRQGVMPDGDYSEDTTTKTAFEENIKQGTAVVETNVAKPVKTLEEALAVANVDESKWEVEKWVCNSWGVTSFSDGVPTYRTNYQVKVWLKKIDIDEDLIEAMLEIVDELRDFKPKMKIESAEGSEIGVVTVTDFHLGADVKQLLRTNDFNLDILIQYLHQVADFVNSHEYEEVHLNMLGDFFESLSGLNHENTFKSLGSRMWGGHVLILTHQVISQHFFSRINNLKAVNIVAGNHDRMTKSKTVDNTGEGARVLWYMLQESYPELVMRFSESVLVVEIDEITYILTHGDKSYSRKDFSKFVLDYKPDNDKFVIVIEGHLHSRLTKKVAKAEMSVYEDIEVIEFDEMRYRKYVCPSLFTGNFYSESLGYASPAGFLLMENNGNGIPNVLDATL